MDFHLFQDAGAVVANNASQLICLAGEEEAQAHMCPWHSIQSFYDGLVL